MRSLTTEQVREMEARGFAYLTPEQLSGLYDGGSKLRCSQCWVGSGQERGVD